VSAIKKITVDTNILISFFVYPTGIVREIIGLAINKHISICISPDIIEEYMRVLRLKFGWTETDISANIGLLKRMTLLVHPELRIKAVRADSTDDKIIECAVTAGADAIISGDKHLLNLKKYKNIPMMKPAELLRILAKQ
jgi:putative PIN family toxin of toxin-antitoxin system